jgi:hypothetical protein
MDPVTVLLQVFLGHAINQSLLNISAHGTCCHQALAFFVAPDEIQCVSVLGGRRSLLKALQN